MIQTNDIFKTSLSEDLSNGKYDDYFYFSSDNFRECV